MDETIANREHAYTDKLDSSLFPKSKRTEIVTFTGRYIDPVEPDSSRINIVDIAHALALSCRYGGHCPRFYSVAEHSILVHNLMEKAGFPKPALFAGLMHDAEEAYLMDMPTPIKRQFQTYVDSSINLRKVIWSVYGIDWTLYKDVEKYDQEAYQLERKRLWDGGTTMEPPHAKAMFLSYFELYGTI